MEYFFLKQKLVMIKIILTSVLACFIIAKTLKHRSSLFCLYYCVSLLGKWQSALRILAVWYWYSCVQSLCCFFFSDTSPYKHDPLYYSRLFSYSQNSYKGRQRYLQSLNLFSTCVVVQTLLFFFYAEGPSLALFLCYAMQSTGFGVKTLGL